MHTAACKDIPAGAATSFCISQTTDCCSGSHVKTSKPDAGAHPRIFSACRSVFTETQTHRNLQFDRLDALSTVKCTLHDNLLLPIPGRTA